MRGGEQACSAASEDDVDVAAILDVNMPGMSGIETAARHAGGASYIVFLTAHPEHAVKAFEVGAVDYVLEPVDDARLEGDRTCPDVPRPQGPRDA